MLTDEGANRRAGDLGLPAMEGTAAGHPVTSFATDGDARLHAWLERCGHLADSDLDGIEDPASELADLAAGDRRMMERSRRVLLEALAREPDNATLQQMLLFWRRAFEKGSWQWDASPIDHNPYLS